MLAEAEALSDGARYREAAGAWGRLAEALRKDGGPGDPRAFSADVRRAAELYGIREDRDAAGAAAASARDALSAGSGRDAAETLFAAHVSALLSGDASGAAEELREVERASGDALGPLHPQTLAAMAARGSAMASGPGPLREGAEILERAVALQESVLGPDHPDALWTASALAVARMDGGDGRQAAEILGKALDAQLGTLAPDGYDAAAILFGLSLALSSAGDPDGAARAAERGLEMARSSLGGDHELTLALMEGRAAALFAGRDAVRALVAYREAAEAQAGVLGAEHPRTLATLSNYALAKAYSGDPEGAAELLEGVLEAMVRTLGKDARATLTATGSMADALSMTGDLAGSAAMYRRAAEGLARTLGPDHPDTLGMTGNLALVLRRTGDLDGAVDLARRAAEALSAGPGPDDPRTLAALSNLAGLTREAGDPAGARDIDFRVLEALGRTLGPEHPETLAAAANLASSLHAAGDLAAAAGLYRRSAAALAAAVGPGSPEALAAANNLGLLLAETGDFAGAYEVFRAVLAEKGAGPGPPDESALGTELNLGRALQELGDLPGALDVYARVLEEASWPPDHPDRLRVANNVAAARLALGDGEGAGAALGEALEIRERTQGPDHPDTVAAKVNLALYLLDSGDAAGAGILAAGALESVGRLGPDHPIAVSAELVSVLASGAGTGGEAAAGLAAVLERAVRVSGPSSPQAAWTEFLLGGLYRELGEYGTAVFWLKLSVDAAQRARLRMGSLDEGLRLSYMKTVELRYQVLFDLLMKMGRTGEAMEVLDLLKDSELGELVPEPGAVRARPPARASGGAPESFPASWLEPAPFPASGTASADPGGVPDIFAGTPEAEAAEIFLGLAEGLHGACGTGGDGKGGVPRRLRPCTGPGGPARRPNELPRPGGAGDDFVSFCRGLPGLVGPGGGAGVRERELRGMEAWRRAAGAAGEGAAVVFAVSAPETLHLVMVSRSAVTARESAVGRRELSELAAEFRSLLRGSARDPRDVAGRLYDAVVRPLEGDLERAGVRTLLLNLDGPLRYVPFAALWDGERWLVESYSLAIFTRATAEAARRGGEERPAPSATALGVTAAWPGYPALGGVAEEIAAVVGGGGTPGVLQGVGLLDAEFDREALERGLSSGAPVMHVASHFRLDPGDLGGTALLLGDGGALTLREIRSGEGLDFSALDLLTLSACDTGSGAVRRRDGREVESLGEIVQRAGASAVLATLMPVDDSATPGLMRTFYRLRYVRGEGKAEALRGAQLSVMRDGGASARSASRGVPRGTALGSPAGAAGAVPLWRGTGHSHPFFWAPFVVMGDWR
jgi:CHAT domain-containing protein/tetratricopeptide (TPR) repeat protein